MFKRCLLLLSALVLLGVGPAYAVSYVTFDEQLTVNFGDPEKPKLSYLRVNVSLKVADDTTATTVRNHEPFIRDLIIRHLVRQKVETVRTGEAKSQLLSDIKTSVTEFLTEEEGEPLVEDVLFTEFVVQE